jgi:hypothetical protein
MLPPKLGSEVELPPSMALHVRLSDYSMLIRYESHRESLHFCRFDTSWRHCPVCLDHHVWGHY